MSQSLANILTHLIFSTKNRESLLADKHLRQRAHAYLAAVLKDLRCPALIVGGVADHVLILCQLAKTQSVSVVMEHVKTSSSKWLKTEGIRTFSWQRGYGAFSVSQSNVAWGCLLHRKAGRASPNRDVRRGISAVSQALPCGVR